MAKGFPVTRSAILQRLKAALGKKFSVRTKRGDPELFVIEVESGRLVKKATLEDLAAWKDLFKPGEYLEKVEARRDGLTWAKIPGAAMLHACSRVTG